MKRERDPLKTIKVTITDAPSDKYHEVWSALDNVINAWEKLEQVDKPRSLANWLEGHMSPAINRARTAMGRKAPK